MGAFLTQRMRAPGRETTGWKGSLQPCRAANKPLLLWRLLPTSGLEAKLHLLRLYFIWRKFEFVALVCVECPGSLGVCASRKWMDFRVAGRWHGVRDRNRGCLRVLPKR